LLAAVSLIELLRSSAFQISSVPLLIWSGSWQSLAAMAGKFFPDLPLVGYDRAYDLADGNRRSSLIHRDVTLAQSLSPSLRLRYSRNVQGGM
jgi:hypothetical protein